MRIVIKIGSGVLSKEDSGGELDLPAMLGVVENVAKIIDAGHHCVLVSSGAVSAGLRVLGLDERPKEISALQACASVGQSRLMHFYEDFFKIYGLATAQILLTHDDLRSEKQNQQIKNTLKVLEKMVRIVPIINENDPVAAEEIKLGDNDLLSVRAAVLLEADFVFFLTSVDGLLRRENGKRILVSEVKDFASAGGLVDSSEKGKFSSGGMNTKLLAAKEALANKIPTAIINGRFPERMLGFLEVEGGKKIGTFFPVSG